MNNSKVFPDHTGKRSMNSKQANALIDEAIADRATFQRTASTLDGLKASGIDTVEAAERTRQRARKAEKTLLQRIKDMADAVEWTNAEITDAATRMAMIEAARQAMELTDSSIALIPTANEAEGVFVELSSLRSQLLGAIGLLASTLNPWDGRTSAADIGSHRTFPDGPDLFTAKDADAAGALARDVDSARRAIAEHGIDLPESEFEQLLG
jgi:hypothetical protein